jgi:hypothetical protein
MKTAQLIFPHQLFQQPSCLQHHIAGEKLISPMFLNSKEDFETFFPHR